MSSTAYGHDGRRCVAEFDLPADPPVLKATWLYGDYIDEPLIMWRDVNNDGTREAYTYHQDAQYSVVALTNEAGQVVERYDYDPWGKPTIYAPDGSTRNSSAVGNPFMYTGQRYEPETGLYEYKFRHYSPDLKRFLTTDPIGPWGDAINMGNPYGHVGNIRQHG